MCANKKLGFLDIRRIQLSEDVTQRCSVKKVFLEISQNSATRACNFIKKETLAQVFSCEFCEISKNIFFYRTPLVVASKLWIQEFFWRIYSFLKCRISFIYRSDINKFSQQFSKSLWIKATLSDFHKMAATVIKMNFKKLQPSRVHSIDYKIVHYRDYKNVSYDFLREYLLFGLSMEDSLSEYDLEKLLRICVSALETFALYRKNLLFMNRNLNKPHMKRSRLQNWFLQNYSAQTIAKLLHVSFAKK